MNYLSSVLVLLKEFKPWNFIKDVLIGGEQPKNEDDFIPESILEKNNPPFNNDLVVRQKENQTAKDVKIMEKPVISVQSSDIQSMEELDQKVEESYSKDSDGFYSCHYCAKSFKLRGHIKEHVEIHFEGLSFPCTHCDSILRSRSSLRQHTKKKHYS